MTLTVEPDPATIDVEVERALAATVWEILSPTAAALTALYFVFVVGHLLVLPTPVARPMAALAEAHDAGLVHRDIKPDNIFLHQTPRGEVVKVLDFGIAKLVSDAAQDERNANAEQTRGLVGTPSYVAPERVAGRDYDGRADVYGVGVTLYVMLTGRLPFPAAKGQSPFATAWMHVSQDPIPPQTVRPDLGPEVAAFVLRVLARDPDGRPTARQMAGELEVLRSVS